MICIKKLNSRRGAAVIIALLVSFIAALSGTVALVMSSSNAGRAGYNKEEQQAYLSIASAAQLISDTFKNLTATVKEEGGNYSVTYSGGEETLFLADERFKKDLYLASKQSAVEEGYFNNIYFTLNLNEDVVYVDLNMERVLNSDVGLVFELSVKNYRPYYMRVKCHIPENLSDSSVKITFGDATFEAQGGTASSGGGD